MLSFPLHPHPTTPPATAASFAVAVELARAAVGWRLRYRIEGPTSHLRIPPRLQTPMQADGLWRHTCCELFCGQPERSAYEEFNFGPSGAWAHYAFAAERVPAASPATTQPPAITIAGSADALIVTVDIVAPIGRAPCRIGLSAVLEDSAGDLSYWALAHSKRQPDFHDRAGWMLLPVN